MSAKGFDFDGELVEDRRAHKVLGVHYDADAEGTAWFDPAMKAMQAKIDARLPGLVNTDRCRRPAAARSTRPRHVSSSDRQPPLFFLYEIARTTR